MPAPPNGDDGPPPPEVDAADADAAAPASINEGLVVWWCGGDMSWCGVGVGVGVGVGRGVMSCGVAWVWCGVTSCGVVPCEDRTYLVFSVALIHAYFTHKTHSLLAHSLTHSLTY